MSSYASGSPDHGLHFNPHIAALPPYNAGMNVEIARTLSGRGDIARLASNENPDGCSPAVREALASAAFEPWRYADPACTALRCAIAEHLQVDVQCVVAGNGSEELIAAVSRAMLAGGAEVVTTVPSFGLHEIEPLAMGASVIKIPMTGDLGFDLPGLVAAIGRAPRLVFLSSPWNPVGPALDRPALLRLIGAVQRGTLLVLDEAYFEFMGERAVDGLEVLKESAVSYVVLRTFSKAYGLAGLRVGYAVCSDPEIARVVAAAKTPFNVNAAAQLAAVAALRDQAWMAASVDRLRQERERMRAALDALNLRIAPSETNFLFVETPMKATEAAEALLMEGIIVKAWREPGYENFLRITIGRREENDRLIQAMSRLSCAEAAVQ